MIKKILMALVALVFSLILCRMASDGKEIDTYIDSQYQQYCVEIGEIYGICPELLMAMIEAESSGNPDATNGTCKGLMQVSKKWHKDRMERLGVKDIYDPYGNILVATDYLMELSEKYEDLGLVLDLYNGNSKAWYNAEHGILSKYAAGIIERSAELERVRGK